MIPSQTPWLLQVTPALSVVNHGINDYAQAIAVFLRAQDGIPTDFYTTEPARVTAQGAIEADASLSNLHRDLITRFQQEPVQPGLVFFHFDYGSYGWWDLPAWLPMQIRRMRRVAPTVKWAFFFHEFHPSKPRCQRERLLWPVSREIMRWVLNQADLAVCTNPAYEKAIHRLRPRVSILRIPVFSTVGEPDRDACCHAKKPAHWVVFGSTGNLPRYLRRLLQDLPEVATGSQPVTVSIIGGNPSQEIAELGEKLQRRLTRGTVNYQPNLPVAECSAILSQATHCYLPYLLPDATDDSAMVLKSTVFAAANAHGLITVFGGMKASHLAEQLHHPGIGGQAHGRVHVPEAAPGLAEKIHAWYHEHSSLAYCCRRLREALRLPQVANGK